jgi:hypothetical protein
MRPQTAAPKRPCGLTWIVQHSPSPPLPFPPDTRFRGRLDAPQPTHGLPRAAAGPRFAPAAAGPCTLPAPRGTARPPPLPSQKQTLPPAARQPRPLPTAHASPCAPLISTAAAAGLTPRIFKGHPRRENTHCEAPVRDSARGRPRPHRPCGANPAQPQPSTNVPFLLILPLRNRLKQQVRVSRGAARPPSPTLRCAAAGPSVSRPRRRCRQRPPAVRAIARVRGCICNRSALKPRVLYLTTPRRTRILAGEGWTGALPSSSGACHFRQSPQLLAACAPCSTCVIPLWALLLCGARLGAQKARMVQPPLLAGRALRLHGRRPKGEPGPLTRSHGFSTAHVCSYLAVCALQERPRSTHPHGAALFIRPDPVRLPDSSQGEDQAKPQKLHTCQSQAGSPGTAAGAVMIWGSARGQACALGRASRPDTKAKTRPRCSQAGQRQWSSRRRPPAAGIAR